MKLEKALNSHKIWCLVPAAGSGRRFGGGCPKQYRQIKDKPVLQITLEVLLQLGFERILVALSEQDNHWQHLAIFKNPDIETVTGGNERADSVMACLMKLQNRAADHDWVLIHDVARPCVTADDIQTLISEIKNHPQADGGILVSSVTDTIKQAEQGLVSSTLDRSKLWAALTPQMFRYSHLKNALEALAASGTVPTDEASAIEFYGGKVAMVKGRRDNIKITQPEDLFIAEAIIAYQRSEGIKPCE